MGKGSRQRPKSTYRTSTQIQEAWDKVFNSGSETPTGPKENTEQENEQETEKP